MVVIITIDVSFYRYVSLNSIKVENCSVVLSRCIKSTGSPKCHPCQSYVFCRQLHFIGNYPVALCITRDKPLIYVLVYI